MAQSVPDSIAGNIGLTVIPQPNGHYICRATMSLQGQAGLTKESHGQNPKHAIAVALENLARQFRMEAEKEQNINWDTVDRSPSGKVAAKRFHIILHYEEVTEDESKFEAMHNTLLGNTVVEGAELAIIQIDPDLPIEPLKK